MAPLFNALIIRNKFTTSLFAPTFNENKCITKIFARFLPSFLLSVLIFASDANAQNDAFADSINSKMGIYAQKKEPAVLYAHLDKTVYTGNETIWFTAYLAGNNLKNNNPSVLSATLIRDHDKKQILTQRFVMANGIASGSLFLPDTLAAGDYSMMLYTNITQNGYPVNTFSQPITIKATGKAPLSARLSMPDSSVTDEKGYKNITLKATNSSGQFLPDAGVTYYIGDKLHPRFSGKIKTDQIGKGIIAVPVSKLDSADHMLETETRYGKNHAGASLSIPFVNRKYNVGLYPEGGSLVNGIPTRVGVEVTKSNGIPAQVVAVLSENGRPIETIRTDMHGLAAFNLIPDSKKSYNVKVLGDETVTLYKLPRTLSSGPVIHIEQALANDSLRIRLTGSTPGKYFIAVHNYTQLYYYIPVITNAAGRSVLINLQDLPKGLETITVLDSLHRPCCERLFFAHFDKRPSITVSTDQEVYDRRQLVHLKIRLNGDTTDATHGLVSIACVQRGRIESMKANNIDSYVYLGNQLANLPAYREPIKLIGNEKPFLEKLLLVKGWRRYTWQEMADSKPADTAQAFKKLLFTGDVMIGNKPLKKAITFLLWAGTATTPVSTTANGHFELSEDQLLVEQGKKVGLFLPDRARDYSVSFAAGFTNMEEMLANQLRTADYQDLRIAGQDDDNVLAGFEHNIHLKEVVISAKKNSEDIPGKNACGDYVCRFGVLNCPNHPNETDNVNPKPGKRYFTHVSDIHNTASTLTSRTIYVNGSEWREVIYTGCTVPSKDPLTAIQGISYAKEFYPADYSQPAASAPDYVSTIYWKHLCLLNPGKDTDLSFYTSDTTGPFRIVIQGITNNDFISLEKDFTVENKASGK